MPLYEYRCAICGTQEEKLQAFAAADSHDCPECETPAGMQRQLSVAAFSLSGGGWYKEGYGGAKEGPAKEGPAKEGPGKEGAEKPAAAEAAKPAAKPAAPTAGAPEAAPSKPAGGCGGGCACH